MYNKLTESTTELAISIRENAMGEKHNIRKQRTVTVTLKAFLYFKNFSLASNETCWAAIFFF